MIVITLLLPACGEQESFSTPDYFIPPTLSHSAKPISFETPTPILPTATIACENNLAFVDDVSIPDGSKFAPGDVIEKIWLVENSGTCNWNADYRVRFIDGDPMGAGLEQALFPARSGNEAEIRITFVAPNQTGLVLSSWQAYSPEGQPFGTIIYISIIVDPDLPPTNTPTPKPTSTLPPTSTP
ncbi:MAG: NBR1-Ig-like domain-containing protein, partial [Anaerolineales bacterium]